MKRFSLITLCLGMLFALGACSDSTDITNVPTDEPQQSVTAGEIHTEFLDALYAKGDFAKSEKSVQLSNAATIANEIMLRHGLTPLSDTEIEESLQRGRDMAQMDPVELIQNILTPEEQVWWDRFSFEAKIHDARKVYNKHVRLYGAPTEGGTLSYLQDVGVASAEFWSIYREKDIPTYHNPYVPDQAAKSWRGVLRFVVAVVVDGGAGAASAAGGPIVSGVVGGLASTGADHIIFGD